ncbi:uncharacterized protein LOC135372450 [Ornithodoros turicata]|uniref:uncharacterized protein LOC135372450 n=1 Tax=Ornithodoros turicata TaxID=34597 RepID=UPI00313A06E7
MDSTHSKNPDRRHKRHRTEVQTLQFFNSTAEPWFPKILILQAEDQSKALASISPFLIAKTLEQVIGKAYNAKKLRTGDIHIEVQNRQQSSALLSLKQIGDIPVLVTAHRTLNTVRGVISCEELLQCSETEIEEGLKDQGVISAKRISIRRDNKEIPTRHVILSFQLHTLPTEIKAGYVNCHVRPYIPNPRRCFKCQRFGHHSQVCRGRLICPKCAGDGNDHTPESCKNTFRCVNCEGNHPSYSRSCPRFSDEKEILKIKTVQQLTYKAAKTQLEFQKKGSFSEAVRRGVASLRVSVGTQTCGPPLHTPQTQEKSAESSSPPAPATISTEVDGAFSVWDGLTGSSSQTATHSMELDDDDCMSQKSSSSLPSTLDQRAPSQGKEQREKHGGRGRGKSKEKQRLPPPRVIPP